MQNRDLAETDISGMRLTAAVENMAQGLCMFDADQRLVICNKQYARIYELPERLVRPGTPHDEIVAYRLASGMHWPGGPKAFVERNRERLARGEAGVETVLLRNGRIVEVRHQPMADGGWVATHSDITDLQRREDELRLQNIRFDAAVNNMTQGLCMFDGDRNLVVSNHRFAEIYELPDKALAPGTSFEVIVADLRTRNGDRCPGARALVDLATGVSTASVIVEMARGRTISILHHRIADGGWVSTHEDISEQRRNEARIRYLAGYDTLTDLPNRNQFHERIAQIEASISRGEQIAILCIDLDRFKFVNDTLGHAIGDGVLRVAGARIMTCCRNSDFIARLGGDEFAVLQGPINDLEDAALLARRIVAAASAPIEVEGHRVLIGASVGIAIAPSDGSDATALMRNADLALYRAKKNGRDNYCFYEPGMKAAQKQRLEIEMGLRTALARRELSLVYQPLVNLADNRISACEALLRWNHPDRGPVPPSEFVPIAEETGLITSIGRWVLLEACETAATWPGQTRVCVNLSPLQFVSKTLVQDVELALKSSGLEANRLELEVTESLPLADSQATLETLHWFRKLGIRISMDDFGTGSSSLGYLRSFPFDKLKIDRSFVEDSSTSPESLAIVKAVIGLGRSLGIETTAEGVETEAQLDLVRSEGATEAQGFLLSLPLPKAAIGELLDRLRRGTSAKTPRTLTLIGGAPRPNSA